MRAVLADDLVVERLPKDVDNRSPEINSKGTVTRDPGSERGEGWGELDTDLDRRKAGKKRGRGQMGAL